MQNQPFQLSRLRLLFALLALGLAIAIGAYALFHSATRHGGSGVAAIGGPFSMVNHQGRAVTEKDFAGKPMLVFFGYTFCPDVCPTELQVMAAALAEMGAVGRGITPVLVTVDPARDTPETLSAYVANFGENFVGLTGSEAQVAAMAKAYKVYYRRQENAADPDSYLMDHSSIIYLMDGQGRFLKHFTYTTDASALAKGIAAALAASPAS